MKQPVELYPDFSHLTDRLEEIEKLVKRYNLDIDESPKADPPITIKLSRMRKVLLTNNYSRKING